MTGDHEPRSPPSAVTAARSTEHDPSRTMPALRHMAQRTRRSIAWRRCVRDGVNSASSSTSSSRRSLMGGSHHVPATDPSEGGSPVEATGAVVAVGTYAVVAQAHASSCSMSRLCLATALALCI